MKVEEINSISDLMYAFGEFFEKNLFHGNDNISKSLSFPASITSEHTFPDMEGQDIFTILAEEDIF